PSNCVLCSSPNEVELTLAGVNTVSVRNAPVRAVSFLNVVTSPLVVVLGGGGVVVGGVVVGGGVVDVGGVVIFDESPPPPQAPNSAATAHTAMYLIPRGLQMSPEGHNLR